jgi:hypothetical protein
VPAADQVSLDNPYQSRGMEHWRRVDREIAIVTAERPARDYSSAGALAAASRLPAYEALLSGLVQISNGLLAARVDSGTKADDVCVTPPYLDQRVPSVPTSSALTSPVSQRLGFFSR